AELGKIVFGQSLEGVKLGISEAELVAVLGEPERITLPKFEGYGPLVESAYVYSDDTMNFTFSNGVLSDYQAQKNYPGLTKDGIGIGTPRNSPGMQAIENGADVQFKYGSLRSVSEPHTWFIGFDEGKVSSIRGKAERADFDCETLPDTKEELAGHSLMKEWVGIGIGDDESSVRAEFQELDKIGSQYKMIKGDVIAHVFLHNKHVVALKLYSDNPVQAVKDKYWGPDLDASFAAKAFGIGNMSPGSTEVRPGLFLSVSSEGKAGQIIAMISVEQLKQLHCAAR
ncbi:MAG: hypothetical protein JKY56_10400, partial [Kofleriaceae bacterium]|nr:hypothetical protein [Kofleriaceae bacterium]